LSINTLQTGVRPFISSPKVGEFLSEFNGRQHLRVTDHGASDGRLFDDVVLLNHGQDVAPKLSHLAVVLLDHFCASRNIARNDSSR
jgi:hypothetical protein